MKYIGVKGLEVTIHIDIISTAYENEELVKSGILSLIATNAHVFKVLIPENIRTMNDAKYIAFECVMGHAYTKDISQFFNVTLKNIKYLGQDIIYCLTMTELADYNIDKIKEYIRLVEKEQQEQKNEVNMEAVMPDEC